MSAREVRDKLQGAHLLQHGFPILHYFQWRDDITDKDIG